jgi:phosphonate utilization transcriptional regulator
VNTLKFVQTHSLAGLVQHEILRMILTGEVAMGERLNEAALSVRFGVSRGPVREAFRSLEESGLLRQEKNRGVFVREITVVEAEQIYELREVLDELIGRKVAARVSDVQLKALRKMHGEMRAAVEEHDVSRYYTINLRFHDFLAECANNGKLSALYRRLTNELHVYRLRGLSQSGGLRNSNDEHRAILRAIEAGDVEAAGHACKTHVVSSRGRMRKTRDD